MSFGVIVVLGLLLELRSRRCFLMSTKCGELQWQPSGFAALLSDTVSAVMRPFSAVPAAKECSSAKERSSGGGASGSCCRPSEDINAASSRSTCCSSSTAGPSAVPSAPGCCSGQSSAAGGTGSGSGSGVPNSPCGVQTIEQIEACQRLLDDRNALAKQQRALQQKCVQSPVALLRCLARPMAIHAPCTCWQSLGDQSLCTLCYVWWCCLQWILRSDSISCFLL